MGRGPPRCPTAPPGGRGPFPPPCFAWRGGSPLFAVCPQGRAVTPHPRPFCGAPKEAAGGPRPIEPLSGVGAAALLESTQRRSSPPPHPPRSPGAPCGVPPLFWLQHPGAIASCGVPTPYAVPSHPPTALSPPCPHCPPRRSRAGPHCVLLLCLCVPGFGGGGHDGYGGRCVSPPSHPSPPPPRLLCAVLGRGLRAVCCGVRFVAAPIKLCQVVSVCRPHRVLGGVGGWGEMGWGEPAEPPCPPSLLCSSSHPPYIPMWDPPSPTMGAVGWGQWGGCCAPPGPFLLCALLYPLLQDLSSGRCSPHPPGEVEKRPLLCPHPTPGPPQSPPRLWDPHLHHNYAKPALLGGGCIWGGRRGGCAVSPSVMSPAWHGMLLGCSQCSSVVWGERGGLIQPGFAPHMHPMPARRKLCG